MLSNNIVNSQVDVISAATTKISNSQMSSSNQVNSQADVISAAATKISNSQMSSSNQVNSQADVISAAASITPIAAPSFGRFGRGRFATIPLTPEQLAERAEQEKKAIEAAAYAAEMIPCSHLNCIGSSKESPYCKGINRRDATHCKVCHSNPSELRGEINSGVALPSGCTVCNVLMQSVLETQCRNILKHEFWKESIASPSNIAILTKSKQRLIDIESKKVDRDITTFERIYKQFSLYTPTETIDVYMFFSILHKELQGALPNCISILFELGSVYDRIPQVNENGVFTFVIKNVEMVKLFYMTLQEPQFSGLIPYITMFFQCCSGFAKSAAFTICEQCPMRECIDIIIQNGGYIDSADWGIGGLVATLPYASGFFNLKTNPSISVLDIHGSVNHLLKGPHAIKLFAKAFEDDGETSVDMTVNCMGGTNLIGYDHSVTKHPLIESISIDATMNYVRSSFTTELPEFVATYKPYGRDNVQGVIMIATINFKNGAKIFFQVYHLNELKLKQSLNLKSVLKVVNGVEPEQVAVIQAQYDSLQDEEQKKALLSNTLSAVTKRSYGRRFN
jgi:hypothetical protein